METATVTSGLSQWVIFEGRPFSIEIFRQRKETLWTLEIIDAIGHSTLWSNHLEDDALAFIEAMAIIHETAHVPDRTLKTVTIH